MRQLTVISAGLSTPSATRNLADQLAAAVSTGVSARGESLTVSHIEIAKYTNELLNVFTTGVSTPELDEIKESITNSDALIAVTPVFAASYSGLFKMFFDALDPDTMRGMPVLIAATAGTPRHSLVLDFALRPLFAYLRAIVMPTGVFAATDDFGGEASQQLGEFIARAAAELADHIVSGTGTGTVGVGGLGGATAEGQGLRRRRSGIDPMDEFQPFSALLREHDGNAGPARH